MNVRAYEELLRTAADKLKANREAMEARSPKPALSMEDATLRDWFAGMVLQSLVPHALNSNDLMWVSPEKDLLEAVAGEAYSIADAMLKAREQ